MKTLMRISMLTVSALAVTACTNLAPIYERPDVPVPPVIQAQLDSRLDNVTALTWQDVVQSEELESLIALALQENRDLRIAAANIEIARAQYGISRSALLPSVAVAGGATIGDTFDSTPAASQTYAEGARANVGVTSYELDLFSRVRNQNEAALQSWLATIEGKRSAEIAIASTVAQLWVQLATDKALLDLAEETVRVQGESLDLTRELLNAGVATELDTRRASTSVETARAQAAQSKAQIRQDLNALRFVVGTDLPPGILEAATLSPEPVLLQAPSSLNSDVLINRPDVLQAEYALIAANANIGVARAAFYPSISLTGEIGAISTDLGDLVGDAGTGWSFGPSISLPIFDNGQRQANLEASQAQRDLAVAQYEQAIQTAFQETADALAVAETIDERLSALTQLEEDTSVTLELSQERFRVGVDDYLSVLDAQQSAFDASRQLINAQRDQAINQVTLFQALGVNFGTPDQ